jgi:hypothetical protein
MCFHVKRNNVPGIKELIMGFLPQGSPAVVMHGRTGLRSLPGVCGYPDEFL